MSAIINITNAASTATPNCNSNLPAMETLAEEFPPPKKQYPDFSKPHSDDNSVASNDDSEEWMRDEEGTMATIPAQNASKEKEADELEDIVGEVQEWEIPMLRKNQLTVSNDIFLLSSLGDFRGI